MPGAQETRPHTSPAATSPRTTTTATSSGTHRCRVTRTVTSTRHAMTTVAPAITPSASGPCPWPARSRTMASSPSATVQTRLHGTAPSGPPRRRRMSDPAAGFSGRGSATGSVGMTSGGGATSRLSVRVLFLRMRQAPAASHPAEYIPKFMELYDAAALPWLNCRVSRYIQHRDTGQSCYVFKLKSISSFITEP